CPLRAKRVGGPARPLGPPRSPHLVAGEHCEAGSSFSGDLRPAVKDVGAVCEERAGGSGDAHLDVGERAGLDPSAAGEVLKATSLALWPVRACRADVERYNLGWPVSLVDVGQQDEGRHLTSGVPAIWDHE